MLIILHRILNYLITKIGTPDPLTQAIIIDIQVPMNNTLPNTNGCSGSLKQTWSEVHLYHLHDSRFVYLCIVSIRVGPESSNSTDDGGNNGGRQQPRLDLLPHVGQVGAGVDLS